MVLQLPSKLIPRQSDVRETSNIVPSPTIGDYTDAQHDHSNAAAGGAVSDVSIDHNSTTNTHNLTTDINHDALTNFASNEHFTEASIDHANITNIGTNTHAEIDSHLAGTDQTEVNAFLKHTNTDQYETIYTVTAGKSYFIDTLVFSNKAAAEEEFRLATGASASEVDILVITTPANDTKIVSLNTPLKIAATTRLSVYATDASHSISLVGFEK